MGFKRFLSAVLLASIMGASIAATRPPSFKPGWGLVEAIALVHPAPSPAGGPGNVYRVTVRMENGSVQIFDVTSVLHVGERVELTADGRVIRGQ